MIPFNIIVAVDKKFGIGKEGGLPWHLSADMKHFKQITIKTASLDKKNAVIMGRKTWDSLPEKFKPLANRVNIVVSRNKDLSLPPGVWKAESITTALDLTRKQPLGDCIEGIFIIGGAEIFEQGLRHLRCLRIYLTRILQEFDCDAFFPKHALADFKKVTETPPATEDGITFSFAEYARKE